MKHFSLNDLLNQESIINLFDIFERENLEICLVGGCVRDALLGVQSKDFDIAVNAKPKKIISALKKNNIQYDDFPLKYGSVIADIKNYKFQITALREDINQRGRHTNIVYTDSWEKDAKRRDFTINAIYISANGEIKDYFNGKKHLVENKLEFIGDIEERVKEDYLRIARYYRFLGLFPKPQLNDTYERILEKHLLEFFNYVPNSLVRQEILKMFKNPFPRNSFFSKEQNNIKKKWIKLIKQQFINTKYELGLNKCLNKIDLLKN